MAERLVRDHQQVERLRLARTFGVSYKRLHGWEPRTVQRGFDADGNPVRLSEAVEVVTEVEPEWDDEQRTLARALEAHDGQIGPCGFHHGLTGDPGLYYAPEDERCPMCADIAYWQRVQSERDKEAMKRYGDEWPAAVRWPSDGRRTSWRVLSEAEVAARGSAARAEP